jgi:hypothetical protein
MRERIEAGLWLFLTGLGLLLPFSVCMLLIAVLEGSLQAFLLIWVPGVLGLSSIGFAIGFFDVKPT